MDIWVPDRLYGMMPWLCIAAATLALMLPKDLVVVCCAAYLYGYAAFMLWRRLCDLCRYN